MTTTPDYEALRVKMVDCQVRTTDVTDPRVIDAMLKVEREEFVPSIRRAISYIDEDIVVQPAVGGQPARHLMEPSPFAKLVQLAEIRRTDVVLDVGSGSGYSAAVLSLVAGSVIALESDPTLAEMATATLTRLGYDNVAVVTGPLRDGFASEAPYDVILLEGAVGALGDALFSQLKEGGRLVAVEGLGNAGVAKLYVKDGANLSARRGFNAALKKLPGFELAPAFEF